MRILKIANIANSRNSGMGRVMHSTADELRSIGHTVDFLFSGDVPRWQTGKNDRFTFPMALVNAVRHHIRKYGPYDVVEIHEPVAAWYCYQRKRDKTLPPCVLMSHGLESTQWQLRLKLNHAFKKKTSLKSRILVPLTLISQARYGLKHCHQIMCLNSYDSQYLQDTMGISLDKITVVQNGVSPIFADFQSTISRRAKSLLFVGSWLERKGVATLVEAFTRLHDQDPQIRLTLAGTGYSKDDVLASFPQKLRALICVIPMATDLQLRDLYLQHSVFVFPSYFEPWGLVLMEAAAAGMAIVTTNTGGPKDLFTDNENALLITPFDVEHLVQAVWNILTEDVLRERLGNNAKKLAEQFTWAAAAQGHLSAYERAIQIAKAEMN